MKAMRAKPNRGMRRRDEEPKPSRWWRSRWNVSLQERKGRNPSLGLSFLLGTHHKVEPKHLKRYVAEFAYRLNRRSMETNLFDRLVRACLASETIVYKELIAVPASLIFI